MKIVMAVMVVILGATGLVTPEVSLTRQATTPPAVSQKSTNYVRLQQPTLFTYQELVTLGTTDTLTGRLEDKLHAITTTPFLSNEAYYRGVKPHRPY